ncbi:hypothetical protein FPZ49_31510 [Paenibacillus cremeus]|uniref:Uncharacterized protein n=1 Tax=Paenibacillus cremeus TaxID=2163881 RepID=A0A559JSS5_9BACL|nr:hypothetical protein FPZ49_31510 [Paenibacillus cremeus]
MFSFVDSALAKTSSHGSGTGSKSSSSKVHSYTKKNGTHVNSYHRTTPDHTVKNNYNTKPNLNPWTGKTGTRTYSGSR